MALKPVMDTKRIVWEYHDWSLVERSMDDRESDCRPAVRFVVSAGKDLLNKYNMKIMVKTNKEGGWHKANDKGYGGETELQEMLAKYPDLVPIEDLGDNRKSIKVTVREAGNTDLIGVDEDGNITIIETKLAHNPEIKREVIGQILEYASRLWNSSYEDFDSTIHKIKGEHLLSLMEAQIGNGEEWSSEDFRIAVEENLKEGRFALFVIVDAINDELRQTISYINSRCPDVFVLYALELKYFHEKGVEVILPKLFGPSSGSPVSGSERRRTTKEIFLEEAEKNVKGEEFEAVKILFEFSITTVDDPGWGTGTTRGSIYPRFNEFSDVAIFGLTSRGKLEIRVGYARSRTTSDEQKKNIDTFEKKVNEIGLKLPKDGGTRSFQAREWAPLVDNFIAVFRSVINS